MKHSQFVTTIRKHSKFLSVFFVAIFLNSTFYSCSKVTYSSVLNTKEYKNTEKRTGKERYNYKLVDKATISDPIVALQVNQEDEYQMLVKDYVKEGRDISIFGGATAIGILLAGIISGAIKWEENEKFLGGVLIAGGIAIPLGIGGLASKDKLRYKNPRYKYYYKTPYPLTNQVVSITNLSKTINKNTDKYGIIKFSPLYDFQINYAENNIPIVFNLSVNDINFESKLNLKPSTWLNEYAKIKESGTIVWGSYYERKNSLGTLSKGVEYKILPSPYVKNNLLEIELTPTKKGYISKFDIDTYYSIEKKTNIKLTIQEFIQDKITQWEKQGEFEHPADYKKRMAKYESKVQEWYTEAVKIYQQEYIDLINWGNAEISKYDPNNQTFKVNIPDLDTLIVHVPIEKAREFKGNWFIKKIKNQKFDFFSGDWELSSLEIEVPRTYTAKYDNEAVLNYNPITQFNLKFKELNIDIAENALVDNSKENTLILSYDIKYNLPKTKMSNPDAIAVIIGNANYEFADNVKYALNDAQQIKTYLTSILGFKEENIIFENNASKAVIERIFGAKDNYKGELYNWIKPDKSDLFVFYSGHGAPGLNDKKGYIVPTDCNPQYMELQGYSLETLYENLGNIPSKSTTIVMDACFSGKGIIKNISSITIEPDMPKVFFENGILLTSSTGTEVATWSDEMKQGLFTYFFLKSIHDYKNSDKNGDKKLTIKEIYNYISNESEGVPYYSGRINGFKQHPLISGANENYVLVEF